MDAELLLARATAISRLDVLAHLERPVAREVESDFKSLIERRAHSEPIAYLLGEREFYGRMFTVDSRALIPRPETELLVDVGLAAVRRWRDREPRPRVVDVGTGAGAIAVSVAAEAAIPVLATDISADALCLARENTLRFGADVRLVQMDLLSGLRGPLHVILANLPYVPIHRELPRDVAGYEPHLALFAGAHGTELVERLLRQAADLLIEGSEIAVELDEQEQASPIAALARQLYPGAEVAIRLDGGGYQRVVHVMPRKG